jgi:hypothetical protein
MPLSWNEIKTRAAAFVLEWKDKAPAAREEADAQTFENGFFNIFGVSRSKVAIFEKKVRMKDGADGPDLFGETGTARGYIDLFWKGHIIIEMKSPGKTDGQARLEKAYEQAKGYANALPPADLPKGILICDFINFDYYNLEEDAKRYRFTLSELPRHIELFGYLAGYATVEYKQFDPVNIEAAENMGRLHDRLKETGYQGHQLEVYLVRLLFCLFADDTGIFEPDHFVKYIVQRTSPDGSDLAMHIEKIFEVLNKSEDKRLSTLDEQLQKFPYVNGHLFEERLETADFDSAMREALLNCCTLDWSKISPAIFGAMFQSVMNDEERHDIGAHYTSEENILKLIHPLFLDDLWTEFEKLKSLGSEVRKERLTQFHDKLAALKFLDPACGCGNFLVISYRELRLLEMEVIHELLGGEYLLNVDDYIKVNVDQFYGMEIEEFPARIAQTALWLMDHQMNMQVRERFGQYYLRIPLSASPSIQCTNALTVDWESVVPKTELSYIMGNPPFLGSRIMNREQKREVEKVFGSMKNFGELDYVTCWYLKAAQYIQGTSIEVSFVSTNSICQGLQVPILWKELLYKYGIKINFAHQTFKWSNEARGKAAVYCIIIGIGLSDREIKRIYHYASVTGKPVEAIVNHVNPYLVDASDMFIESRGEPLCDVPPMNFGNMPADGGEFLFTTEEKNDFLSKEPGAASFFRRFISANEFINNRERWCLWLADIEPGHLKKLKYVLRRVNNVKETREVSARPHLANVPHLFAQITQPMGKDFILIPRHSSENRKYIPIGLFASDNIAADSCLIVPDGTLYHFGILTSGMHMVWMRHVCGRLEMRYRYSKDIVYNNFPWPSSSDKQKTAIEEAAQAVLDTRARFPKSSLADLYGPLTMPADLVKAHQKLDRAVEKAYGRSFDDDSQRVAYLFELYQKMSGELFADTKKRGKGRKR